MPKAKSPAKKKKVTADRLGQMQRDISISEFFTKNRHLLGFDNASRALLTSVKEAVDNSLDACEEGGILPDIIVRIEQVGEKRYRMVVEDNGPGIVKAQVPKVFGQLLYGSKFHRLQQARGQQGIGISAAGMYGQLTTGKPTIITSKVGKGRNANNFHVVVDTTANRPQIIQKETVQGWEEKDHGTRVEIEMEAVYKGGKKSVDEYIQTVAFANPHLRLEYWRPERPPIVYPRVTTVPPKETREIKPHPYGVELGLLMRMMQATKSRNVSGFLKSEFSRVSSSVADEITTKAGVPGETSLKLIGQPEAEAIYQAIGDTKIMNPPTNCLAPIGEQAMLEGIKALLIQQHMAAVEAKERKIQQRSGEAPPKVDDATKAVETAESMVTAVLEEVHDMKPLEPDEGEGGNDDGAAAENDHGTAFEKAGVIKLFGKPIFLTAVTRPPKVYRGNPFQVEAALAHGGEMEAEKLAQVYRFANRVPLLYQQGACAETQAVVRTNWKAYDVQQSRGALPTGPLLIMVHIASVWVPFTSEAKEAVAHYDEIIGELKFALQECGRRLSRHLRRRRRVAEAEKKRKYIERYIPHIGFALQDILGLSNRARDKTIRELTGVLERSRKM